MGREGGGTTNDDDETTREGGERRRRQTTTGNRRRQQTTPTPRTAAKPHSRRGARNEKAGAAASTNAAGGDRIAAHKTIKSSQRRAQGPRMSKAAIQEGRLQTHRGEYRKTRKRARKRGIRAGARLFNRGRQSRSGRLDGGSREVVRLTRPPKNGPGLGRPDDDAEALE